MPQPPCQARRPSRRGFTMIELLISIGVLVAIIGIALPVILNARRKGIIIRIQSDLALIATGLEAYKNEFGDYPRFPSIAEDQALKASGANSNGNGLWLDFTPGGLTGTDRGARLLCMALLGPGPDVIQNHVGAINVSNPGEDGAAGPGFRVRRTVIGGTSQLTGKVYGPYIDSSKFKLEYDTTGTFPNFQDAKLLDINGNPILYYPATPGPINTAVAGGFVLKLDPLTYTSTSTQPLYNAYDNTFDITPNARLPYMGALLSENDMQVLLGDANHNGQIDAGESPATTQQYLLWTAGADGRFGIDPSSGKTDDICNFTIPANLQK